MDTIPLSDPFSWLTYFSPLPLPFPPQLHSANPWAHLLQHDYPSMGGPGSFLSRGRQHPLFHRTAKDLLSLRLMDANLKTREKREIQRLEERFLDKSVMLVFRHPTHGIVAESKIPIMHGEDYHKKLFGWPQQLTLYHVLPVIEYEACELTLKMPGALGLLVARNFHVVDRDNLTTARTGTVPDLLFGAEESRIFDEHENIALMDDHFHDTSQCFDFQFSVTCAYSGSMDVCSHWHNPRDIVFCEAVPSEVMRATCCINTRDDFSGSSALVFLRFMNSCSVIARHLQENITEFARLRSRFEEAYLLIEVGVGQDMGGKAFGGMDVRDHMLDIKAFALLPLVDENGLMDLFDGNGTQLQFVEQGVRTGILPATGERKLRISVVDLNANCVMKLSEGYHMVDTSDDGDAEEIYQRTARCSFSCFDHDILFSPSVEESFKEWALPSGEEDFDYVATVSLKVETVKAGWNFKEHEFDSILELWKMLELCLTGYSL